MVYTYSPKNLVCGSKNRKIRPSAVYASLGCLKLSEPNGYHQSCQKPFLTPKFPKKIVKCILHFFCPSLNFATSIYSLTFEALLKNGAFLQAISTEWFGWFTIILYAPIYHSALHSGFFHPQIFTKMSNFGQILLAELKSEILFHRISSLIFTVSVID